MRIRMMIECTRQREIPTGFRMKRCVLLLTVLLGGCVFESDEVTRSVSPNGMADAVVLEGSGGATTSFLYEVCLVPHGKTCREGDTVVSLYDAARSDRASGVNIRWVDPQHLVVEYLKARRVSTNRSPAAIEGQVISVSLREGVVDATAPQGGMSYNKHRGDL